MDGSIRVACFSTSCLLCLLLVAGIIQFPREYTTVNIFHIRNSCPLTCFGCQDVMAVAESLLGQRWEGGQNSGYAMGIEQRRELVVELGR